MSDRILCVDDEPVVLALYQRLLQPEFDVYVADGGEKGLEVIERDGPFAVVIADRAMPGLNGEEFLGRVRETAPESVLVMVTGDPAFAAAGRTVQDGNLFFFLTKPCPSNTFRSVIRAAVEHYSHSNGKSVP